MRFAAEHIARIVEGRMPSSECPLRTVDGPLVWDSRAVVDGCLFAALTGERVDGHDYVGAAVDAGAAAALIEHELDETVYAKAAEAACALIFVDDVREAITRLASAWRDELSARVIAVTGSSGKTTTKDLIRDVFASCMPTVATRANENNELGLPCTVLAADADTRALVVEMGMRGRGQIAQLCEIARPDWAVITNVGESHIELLGSREAIADAKAEAYCALSEGGVAFVNAADEYADYLVARAKLIERGVRVVRFGSVGKAPGDTWATDIVYDACGCACFALHVLDAEGKEEMAFCQLGLAGAHQVANATAAAAVGTAAGIALEDIVRALSASLAVEGRGRSLKASRGFTIIDDAYNANPASMEAALRTLGAIETDGARIAVLGDMLELGDHARGAHERIGHIAAAMQLDILICVGGLSVAIAEAAQADGGGCAKVYRAQNAQDAYSILAPLLAPGDTVLVKASHSVGLDGLVKRLAQDA